MMEYNTPIFFYKKDNHIKNIIREQGVSVCRDFLDKTYISTVLSKFDEGFYVISPKASIGASSRKKKEYLLKGFCLFTLTSNGLNMYLDVICGRNSCRGIGDEILNKVFEYCDINGISKCYLDALPYESLFLYYTQKGFIFQEAVYKRGELKAFSMIKRFDQRSPKREPMMIDDLPVLESIFDENLLIEEELPFDEEPLD